MRGLSERFILLLELSGLFHSLRKRDFSPVYINKVRFIMEKTKKIKTFFAGKIFMENKASLLLVFVMSLFLLWTRLTPHWANFSPVLVLFLLSGRLCQNQRSFLFLPFLGLFISDFFLGFYPGWLFNYLSYGFILFFGLSMKNSLFSFFSRGFTSEGVFFVVSNFGVWLSGGIYPPTGQGLLDCYLMAIPFLKTSLLGTVFFLAGFRTLSLVYERFLKMTSETA